MGKLNGKRSSLHAPALFLAYSRKGHNLSGNSKISPCRKITTLLQPLPHLIYPMMATLPIIPPQSNPFGHPTLTLYDLASMLTVDAMLYAYYISQLQQLVMRGIVECLVYNKEELIEAGDDNDDEEEDDEEGDDDEEEEGPSGDDEGDDDEGEGEDEPPAKRQRRDDDDDKKENDEGEGEDEDDVCLRSGIKLTCRRTAKVMKRMMMMTTTTKRNMKRYLALTIKNPNLLLGRR
jgi:hypothetical protein